MPSLPRSGPSAPTVSGLTDCNITHGLADANGVDRTEIDVDYVTGVVLRLKPISQLRASHDPGCSVQICTVSDFAGDPHAGLAEDQANGTFSGSDEPIEIDLHVEETLLVIGFF